MGRVVVDTSAWVSFLRWPRSAVASEVAGLIDHMDALLTAPVASELFQGARTERETKNLHLLVEFVGIIDIQVPDWIAAGVVTGDLRRRGITVPQLDALIATMARRLGVPVLTHDRHFEHFDVALEYRDPITPADR
ncbi:MAG: PIN domain-containing protein [Anaerolineae bacterium]